MRAEEHAEELCAKLHQMNQIDARSARLPSDERLARATQVLADARDLVVALTEWRAREVADAFVLGCLSTEAIGSIIGGVSGAGVSKMAAGLRERGQLVYLMIREGDDGELETKQVVPISGSRLSYIEVQRHRRRGWKAVPLTWYVDPDTADVAALWRRLNRPDASADGA